MSTDQPMFATDEILWYDNGRWGQSGYAVANPNGKIWTNNSFIDTWRGEMWGIWGSAWEICRHEETAAGDRVSVVEENGRVRFLSLEAGHAPLTSSSRCGFELPADLPYANHEQRLIELGMRPLGLDPNDIFEIPGMGCGLMSCRRTAWPGFNEHFRGFGGEEMYLHEKVRQRGDRCLCLGFLKWLHKFARPGGVKYPLTRWNKVRNYVLGHQELGLPLDRVYEHFVIGGLFSERHWKYLLADPIARIAEPTAGSAETIEELYQEVQSTAWSLNEHMPRLRELAEECFHVTEFSHTRESLVAFAAATESSGGQLVSYNTDSKASAVKPLVQLVAIERVDSPDVSTIEPTDLLFLDTKHTRDWLAGELAKFAPHVARYIVLHDTVLHGARGEDGGPGLLAAVKDFLKEQPEWFVASHAAHQYGLTVLGRQERDRPAEPIHLWAPGYGPGTELKHILESLGIEPGPTCDCRARADQMDAWGVAGCLINRDQIIQWMRDGQSRWGWRDKLAAAAKAVQIGLAFKLNPLDPFPSLIDEAIRRADKEQGVPA